MKHKVPKLTVQLLVAIAMLLALNLVIENYFSIRLSRTLHFQFTFIPQSILGMIAGPVWGAFFSALADPIIAAVSGQDMIPSFILIEAVSAFIYGYFFYRKPLDIQNRKDWLYVTGVVLLSQLFVSFLLTPAALHFHYGTPWLVLYSSRAIKAVFEIPVRIVITMFIIPQLQRIPELRKLAGITK